jgi:polysaccharide biosynthesis transport protein
MLEHDMEILERLRIFRSRWVVVVLILGLSFAALGYFVRSRQAAVYQASARLLVGGYLEDTRPTPQDVQVANDLTKTYAQLVNTYEFREDTIRGVDLRNPDGSVMTPEQLGLVVKVSTVPELPFIDIIASSPEPELAAKIANSLADQLILRSPATPSIEERRQETAIQTQINELTTMRLENNNLLADVDRRAQDAYEFEAIQNLRIERQTLTNNNIQISNTISNLQNTLANIRNRTNIVEVVEPARTPTSAGGTSPYIVPALGFIVGAMMGAGLLLLTDELVPRLNSPERIKRLNGLTLLARTPKMRLSPKPSPNWLVTHKQPLSAAAEAYYSLYTHLHRYETQEAPVYIVSSVRRAEGKSVTAANLAVLLAFAGHKVLIIDANLRQPVLHTVFEVDETTGGLSRLLEASPDDLVALTGDELTKFFKKYIQESNVPNVYVLPRGKLENDNQIASLLLRLPHIEKWLAPLHTRYGIDAFVFDTPATTVSSEAMLLSEALEGHGILVMETRQTSRNQAQEVVDQLNQTRARLAGAVLNKQ